MMKRRLILLFLVSVMAVSLIGQKTAVEQPSMDSQGDGSYSPSIDLTADNIERYNTPLKPNHEALHTECCAPSPFIVQTNKYGLRAQNFTQKKPDNITRILVVGDAYTWGFGVNNSERYTSFLEGKLNQANSSQQYQVINAGIPNWGMKNYYYYLKYRGVDFNPDVIIVGFIWNDRLSERQLENLHERARSKYRSENPNSKHPNSSKITAIMSRLETRWYENTPINQSGFRYMDQINRLANKEDSRLFFYALDNVGGRDVRRFLDEWNASHEASVIYRPEKFMDYWINKTQPKYHVSKLNSDPSEQGHRLLAENLYASISQEIL